MRNKGSIRRWLVCLLSFGYSTSMHQMTSSLGTTPVGKLLVRLAVPTILAQVIHALYTIIDRIYIGHIPESGALALTGVGLSFPIIMLLTAFSLLIGSGGAPQASIKLGQRRKEEADALLSQAVGSLIIVSVILVLIFQLTKRPLLFAFGASENTISYSMDYLRVYLWGTPFVLFSLGLNPFITAQGFSRTSMMTMLLGSVVNIILDPIFIFLLGWGVKGAAFATVISQAVSATWVLSFLGSRRSTLTISFNHMKPTRKVMFPVLALGVSPFFMMSTESLVNIILNSTLQRTGGDLAVGAMSILSSVMLFSLAPLQGLTQGGQPILSYNYGAGNKKRIKAAFSRILISSILFSSTVCLLLVLFPETVVGLFTRDPILLEHASNAMRIFSAGFWMLGFQIACQQAFVSFSKARISLFLALLRKIILLIPLVFLLSSHLGMKGVFLAEPIADIVAGTTTTLLFFLNIRKIIAESGK